MRRRRALFITLLAGGVLTPAAGAATIPVTTTADLIAEDGACSLREAVFAARFDLAVQGCPAGTSGEDLIQLEAAEYRLAAGGANEDGNQSGDLDTGPLNTVRIVGRGMNATTIGGAGDRIFDVFANAGLSLADLALRDGVAPEGQSGGAVRNKGSFTALRVMFANSAAGDGRTPASADDESSVAGDGGAILVSAGSAAITSSTFTGSRAGDGRPGGQTSFPGGSGGDGGAIAVIGGSVSVENSTFQGNRAGNAAEPLTGRSGTAEPGDGGAVAAVPVAGSQAAATIVFSTFSGNAVGSGPSGTAGAGASIVGATAAGSILADAGGACATLTAGASANVTLPGDVSCPGVRVAGDARLSPLADNGGATPTLLPGAGSVAINALAGVPCPGTDQRGLLRPALGACDAGAVEVQPGTPSAAGVVPVGGGVGAGAVVRKITSLGLGPKVFRVSGAGPIGTTVRFTLASAGSVVLTVTRPAAGKRSGRRCVAPSRRLKKAKKCTRAIALPGSLKRTATAGANTLRFSGTLRGKALSPGAYTLVLTLPKAGSAAAVTARKGFRIIR